MPSPNLSFTDDEFMSTVEACVAERGSDYVYQKPGSDDVVATYTGSFSMADYSAIFCYYVKNGKPDCIIGCALNRLGASVEWMQQFEGDPGLAIVSRAIGFTGDRAGVSTQIIRERNRLKQCVTTIQDIQDRGGTWGRALEAGKEAYARATQ